MDNKRLALFLAATALAGTAWPDVAARLSVEAAPAVAALQSPPEGRSLVRLPALEFEFGILADCGPDRVATSVSISVADTRTTLTGDELLADGPIVAAIRLPAQQLSPVAVDGFCSETAADDGANQVLIHDAATAHVSLRCANETGESITYASKSLDVTLVCDALTDDQGDASTATDR
jgi:hypothetical protein